MVKDNYLITWFYGEKKDDESFYPSVGGNTSSEEFQRVYWCCVYDFFKSAKLTQNSELKYLFFTNVEKIPTDIYGINIDAFLKEAGVEVVRLELTYKTPKDWYGAWRNQFFVFDILKYLRNQNQTDANYLILDSDIFITKDLTPVFEDIGHNNIITYKCGFEDDYSIHGISGNQMTELYRNYILSSSDSVTKDIGKIVYKGGEFIGITSSVIPGILETFDGLWEYDHKLYEQQKVKLNEEAHFLSVIYHHLGYDESIANKYIKRMWTALRYDNIHRGDENLLLWHMPAEKKYLFVKMAQYMKKDITEEDFLSTLRQWAGIPGLRIVRLFRKAIDKYLKIR